MSFLDNIYERLGRLGAESAVSEMHADGPRSACGSAMLDKVGVARAYLRQRGVRRDERVVLVAANGINWVALNIAIMSEGAICVPLYARQSPGELTAIIDDCQPSLVVCGDKTLLDELTSCAQVPCEVIELMDVFRFQGQCNDVPAPLNDDDVVTIIYTSGTSGTAKGVMLTSGNVSHMLGCTTERLDELLASIDGRQRIFHYLPFCFCGSWILLLTALSRGDQLMLSVDLERLQNEIADSAPHFFMNVPTFLERVQRGVHDRIKQRGGLASIVLSRANRAWSSPSRSITDRFWLWMCDRLIFSKVRKKISPHLVGLVCGSAPLSDKTQSFFEMMGITVLQVYGLTETTAICTMDRVGCAKPGYVGSAINGIEMKLGEHDEILVKGPNVFKGYWNRPKETAEAFIDGWFRSGDQGQVSDDGNWKIVGRIKNLIILNSGHNIAPESLEDALVAAIPGAQQVLLVGNDRSYLTAIVTGDVRHDQVSTAIDRINITLPHYKRVRGFHVKREPFDAPSGLVTANGKLRRAAIMERYADAIDEMYRRRAS